jgi:hypothetical protein
MDSTEVPRAIVAIHAPARAFAPGTRTALTRLGYQLISAETAARQSHEKRSRPAIRIVDDRQLETLPAEGNQAGIPIILLTGPRGPLPTAPPAFGTVSRRAGVNELFALVQRALEPRPRTVPRIDTALPARCISGKHGWPAAIHSLSERGCLLHSTERLDPDTRVELYFALPRAGLMQLIAQPSHVRGKCAGLAFRNASERFRSAIADYVTTQLTAA